MRCFGDSNGGIFENEEKIRELVKESGVKFIIYRDELNDKKAIEQFDKILKLREEIGDKKGIIAAIHAGRNSTFLEISKKTAEVFIEKFSSNPEDINVVFGASIQKCCYEVSEDLSKIVENSFGKEFVENNYIDLQGINKKQLNDLKIKSLIDFVNYEKDNQISLFKKTDFNYTNIGNQLFFIYFSFLVAKN